MNKIADEFDERIKQEKDALKEEELKALKEKKDLLRKKRGPQLGVIFLLVSAFLLALAAFMLLLPAPFKIVSQRLAPDENESLILPLIISVVCISILIFTVILALLTSKHNTELLEIDKIIASFDSEKLKDTLDENFFTKLVQINFKYIDIYYLQTQEQAKKSFTMAAIASGVGFIVIILGITLMYRANTAPAYLTTGAGILIEFISAVFFYFYNRTILKMSEYHQKLVLTQNIGIALKITDEMTPESKNKTLEILVDRLTLDINKHLSNIEGK